MLSPLCVSPASYIHLREAKSLNDWADSFPFSVLPRALQKRGRHGDSKENDMCPMSHFSPLTLVPLMHLILSASLKVRAVHSSFWIEKDAEQQGRLAQLASNESYCHNLCSSCGPCWVMLSSTCDIPCAQSKHSRLPFHGYFSISSTLEIGFDLFIPVPGAVRLSPPLLAAEDADNLCSCWSTGNFSNSFYTHLGTISSGNDRY